MNPLYPVIKLREGKDDAVKRFHPWIFSGAIAKAAPGLQAGDVVTVTDSHDVNASHTRFSASLSNSLWSQIHIKDRCNTTCKIL